MANAGQETCLQIVCVRLMQARHATGASSAPLHLHHMPSQPRPNRFTVRWPLLLRLILHCACELQVCPALPHPSPSHQVEKLKRTAADAEGALASREAALKEFSREGSKLERERRQGDAEVKARDVRLQRALEEVDKYKQMLQEVKLQVRCWQQPCLRKGKSGGWGEGSAAAARRG